MAQREVSDPSASLARVQAGFKGGFTGLTEALQKRKENAQRLRELILQGRLEMQKQAADPEFQAKQAALQVINQVAPTPELRMRTGIDPAAASRLQELFKGRMTERLGERAKLSEMFGLAPKRQPTLAETQAELQMIYRGAGQPGQDGSSDAFQPTAVTRNGVRYEASPEQQGERKAISESISKEFQSATRLAGALRQVNTTTAQFIRALPSEQRTAFSQRMTGLASTLGARTGIAPNPDLLALLSNQRLEANELIRSFGEVGNLSQSDVEASIDAYNQAGLTDEERISKLVQMAEWASSKLSPRARRFIIKQDPEFVDLFESLGVNFLSPPSVTRLDLLSAPGGKKAKAESPAASFGGFRLISTEPITQ